jgi:transposase-like protein
MQVSGSYARTKSRIDKKCFRRYRWLTMSMNRKKVRDLVEGVIVKPEVVTLQPEVVTLQPEVVTPTPEPVVLGSPDAAFASWTRTRQWEQNVTLRGINPQRLQSVIQSRVEAAFRAGYSAGVGDAI